MTCCPPKPRRTMLCAMDSSRSPSATARHATALGVACGAGSALFWAFGFVAARHGVLAGMSPLVLALHRFIWPGLALLPLVARSGFGDLGGLGWRRGIALTAFGGLPLALWSYIGYVYVPLGHGSVIQPSCAAVGGLVLAHFILKEALPPRRRADYCAGSCGDRLRGIAHDGPSRAVWRSALCRRRQLIRGVRHAAAAVAGRTDACGRDNERAVARRPTDFVVRLRQSHRRWIC